MERVLKKGGISIVATEYVINGKEHAEYFNKQNRYTDLIENLQKKLIEPLKLGISRRTLDNVLDFYSIHRLRWNDLDLEYKKTSTHCNQKQECP